MLSVISGHDGIDLLLFAGLSHLQHLELLPYEKHGLTDEDCAELATLSQLTHLAIRGSTSGMTGLSVESLVYMPTAACAL
jgi:hypothetical protein